MLKVVVLQQVRVMQLAGALGMGLWATAPQAAPGLPYPPVQAGQQRWVVQLPARSHEEQYQVELVPVRRQMVDCNHYTMAGQLIEHPVEGYGYSYYRLEGKPEVSATLMGCPPRSQKMGLVRAASLQISYNSQLPVVVYLPQGVELQYRLWQAERSYSRARPQ